ncbi:NADH-dependent alcohol dehydrogenase [candidate division KSB3 bacterium]|uniref:NADH-dependent alcohol dehydrogenase n=1 Tax=candidate division KSB3 bacterium TaxID=2044937 RepID=A0A2G6E7C2_9BACT|nr:MAG: NADH-dependent alcohol dehydrogenase [candidate division KSB3 bacterium]PIE30197.1 MAG: NADH-dependent alcohol dehydrogenase [candidate division KSB3 bacterium]
MQNFTFWNPTKIIFGEGTIQQIGEESKKFGKKVLFVYGKSSIKASGVYDKAVNSLKEAGLEIVEFSGVQSNPVLSHLREGIALAKREQVDAIVAVGGGSVLDESKAIAAGAQTDGDVWDFFLKKATVEDALPVLTILTLAATGSEMNPTGVVTNELTRMKTGISAPPLFPKVSILDPTATYSVPQNYTAYGAVDAISHILEGYFTGSDDWTPIQDRFVEGLVLSVMASVEKCLENPEDYQGRATLMWAATLALNGLPVAGIGKFMFPNHLIEHSLSALYNIAHGAGLSIVIPGWMKYASSRNSPKKFAQFAERIFGIQEASPESTAEKGIAALQAWFEKIGSPTTLAAGKIPEEEIGKIAENAAELALVWGIPVYTHAVIEDILRLCK